MAKPIAPDPGQQFLFPPALEDWVARDHPARFLREFVDQLDLRRLNFVLPDGSEGRPPYAASLLLKIWLYGYLHRIRSTRRLEAACREHLALLWLTGLIAPDHNSLWRFWRDNKAALRQLFKHSAQLAVDAGLAGLVLQALDGTKIQALASGRTGWSREQMEKLLAALDAQLDQTEQQIQTEGPADEATGYRLPENLEDQQTLRETVRTGLQQLAQDGRGHYHPHEPQARRMKCEGQSPFAYNAQAVVDARLGVVLAVDVTNAEDDQGQLVPLVEQAQANAGSQGPAALTVADGGYGSGRDIAAAAAKDLAVLVPPREGTPARNHPYHARHFHYDPATQTVTCPQGRSLDFQREAPQKGQTVRLYRCHHADCPVRDQCTRDQKSRRVIEIWPHTPAVQALRARLESPEARAQLRRRSEIVERHFGQIKQHDGFRRWTVRGLEGVRTQWALINLAINLRALHGSWRNRPRRPAATGASGMRPEVAPHRRAIVFALWPARRCAYG